MIFVFKMPDETYRESFATS